MFVAVPLLSEKIPPTILNEGIYLKSGVSHSCKVRVLILTMILQNY